MDFELFERYQQELDDEWRGTVVLKLRAARGQGSTATRNQLVMENMRLVYHVIYGFTRRKVLPEDLVQAGVIGLIRAIEEFDYTRVLDGNPKLFFVYARWKILFELQQTTASMHRVFRVPARNSGNSKVEEIPINNVPLEGRSLEESDARHDLAKLIGVLSEKELSAILAFSEGAEAKELTNILGVPKAKVIEITARCRDLAKKALDDRNPK